MSWFTVCASEIGTSHIKSKTPCQDACFSRVYKSQNNQEILSIWVSDGAGSAIYGGEGAQLAIDTAQQFIEEKTQEGEFGLSDAFAVDLVKKIHRTIDKEAQDKNFKPRDFACTFIGVVSSDTCTLVMQVGDGAAVVDVGNDLELAIPPMSGEYANTTYFVTDDDSIQNLKVQSYPQKAMKVAVFSDGLQQLALNYSENKPHQPFFSPFFNTLMSVNKEEFNQLEELLRSFLDSEPVNERTDDDKTLALAVWADNL